eukprot:TRINITY_DN7611_c0_g1::TRINITY_DN7611_c0_g1_i1::g.2012::m.2012 TRINITY_DN7611_c0_g1::TRINITY_DN7611_c0_g1_i1::g.2012  ORF type:complete len:606 (+),score=6.65,sp/Q6PAV2/HERC4_MOUSE/32.37/2e-31,sp/Q6PAV2/HERC4_MOUSE/28.70/4e-25,RCC1/PF00415.13/5.1e+03,RCC1/PF00415.13/13,RCC1/PF00415.13/8.9e-05,RCC1/PF00415.13/6.6e-10,RCC1/PF00415.13/2e-07,RCC1/PF00415.13/0.00014,RCC1/PF00415.13/1.1e-08,RCC1/PF00415.13/0.00016,RCC1_2/PF13540.1/0.0097,RCC1_2/PF13540.1/0.0077,RCC1_2/PF13540.1/6.3e-06,RCC1_2/PF13540.1
MGWLSPLTAVTFASDETRFLYAWMSRRAKPLDAQSRPNRSVRSQSASRPQQNESRNWQDIDEDFLAWKSQFLSNVISSVDNRNETSSKRSDLSKLFRDFDDELYGSQQCWTEPLEITRPQSAVGIRGWECHIKPKPNLRPDSVTPAASEKIQRAKLTRSFRKEKILASDREETEPIQDTSYSKNIPSSLSAPTIESLPYLVATGFSHTLVVDQEGKLFVCGYSPVNGQPMLGLGWTSEAITKLRRINRGDLGSRKVIYAAAGAAHTLLIDADGVLFACGRGGAVGHLLPTWSATALPRMIPTTSGRRVVRVAAGDAHSLCVCEDGECMSWGTNEGGQLGHGNRLPYRTPTKIRAFSDQKIGIRHISGGSSHSLFLTGSGDVYSCGRGFAGQLGHGDDQFTDALIPRKLVNFFDDEGNSYPAKSTWVSAGSCHSLFVGTDGWGYSVGAGEQGQLGQWVCRHSDKPIRVKDIQPSDSVTLAIAGAYHSVFITKDGAVWTCGDGQSGCLGHGSTKSEVLPKRVQALQNEICVWAAAGKYFEEPFTVVVTQSGELYSFGCGYGGRLGRGGHSPGCLDQRVPMKVQFHAPPVQNSASAPERVRHSSINTS